MTYRLYGANGSGSSIVEAALAEIGADYELEAVDAAHGAHREAAYTAVNPHRKLPTLITPEGETLTESAAIVLTLAERHPHARLFPDPGTTARARAYRWMFFAATELYPIVEIIDHPERFSPDKTPDAEIREVALAMWRSRWLIVEPAIGDGPYLLGERFCMTDVYLAALSRWDLPASWRFANIPKLETLAATVARRPKLRDLWPRHFGAP